MLDNHTPLWAASLSCSYSEQRFPRTLTSLGNTAHAFRVKFPRECRRLSKLTSRSSSSSSPSTSGYRSNAEETAISGSNGVEGIYDRNAMDCSLTHELHRMALLLKPPLTVETSLAASLERRVNAFAGGSSADIPLVDDGHTLPEFPRIFGV